MHHDDDGFESNCVVYTTDTKTKVKLKDVKPFGEYFHKGHVKPFAIQFIVPVKSPSYQKILDTFGLTDKHRRKDHETRQRAKRK